MKTSQLMRHLRWGILNERSSSRGADDRLWPDDLLVDYMNEAYQRMAVEGLMIRDAVTPEVTQFALVEGQRDYVLHPTIVAVLSARIQSSQFDLTRADHGTLASQRRMDEHWWDTAAASTMPPGPTLVFTTDEGLTGVDSNSVEQMTFRVFPLPAAAQAGEIIQMRVIRKPLERMDLSRPDYVPEIPSEWHLAMLDWAAYLALRIVDDDAGAPKRAEEFAERFEALLVKSRNQVLGKLRQGQGFKFGRGGFSWESGNNGW